MDIALNVISRDTKNVLFKLQLAAINKYLQHYKVKYLENQVPKKDIHIYMCQNYNKCTNRLKKIMELLLKISHIVAVYMLTKNYIPVF